MKILVLSCMTIFTLILLLSCSDESQDINLTQTQVNEIIVGSGGTYVSTPVPTRTVTTTTTPVVGSSYVTPVSTPYTTITPPNVL